MPTALPATVYIRETFVGVAALARETGLSQGYVSKLLARGWSVDGVRDKAVVAGWKRKIRAAKKGETVLLRSRR